MAGEMTVDGNLTVVDTLHVTTIQSATIDSLQGEINILKQIVYYLQNQMNIGSYMDCSGVLGGDAVINDCGLCSDISDDCVANTLQFDGNNNYVNITSNASLNPWSSLSISAWVMVTGNSGQNRMIVCKGADYDQYAISASGNNKFRSHIQIGASESSSWVYYDGLTEIVENIWYHVVQTYDGNTLRLYVNGEIDSIEGIGSIIPYVHSSGELLLGHMDATEYYFKGNIEKVSIFNIALSEYQIKLLYNKIISPIYLPGLVSYWNINEGQGYIINDYSGNNNGNINGAIWVQE